MSEIKYLPVIEDGECGKEVCVRPMENQTRSMWLDRNLLKTCDDLKAEGAEEYRQVLKKFSAFDIEERVKITEHEFLFDICADDLRNRIKVYENQPKVGEIWENNTGGRVVIYSITDTTVRVYFKTGLDAGYIKSEFAEHYHNTGKTCESLLPFLEELEGLKE